MAVLQREAAAQAREEVRAEHGRNLSPINSFLLEIISSWRREDFLSYCGAYCEFTCGSFLRLPYAHFLALTHSIWSFILCRQSHGGCRVQQHRGEFPHDLFQLRVAEPQFPGLAFAAGRNLPAIPDSRGKRAELRPTGPIARAVPLRSPVGGATRGSGLGQFSSGGFSSHIDPLPYRVWLILP